MKPSLQIYEEQYVFRIQWYFPDVDDFGATLGESDFTEEDLKKLKPEDEDRDHIVATIAAGKTPSVQKNGRGFFWDTSAAAKKALVAIRAAIKSDDGGPWPEWAIKAKANGWTPPKGWKP
jgi:hypothetical protein